MGLYVFSTEVVSKVNLAVSMFTEFLNLINYGSLLPASSVGFTIASEMASKAIERLSFQIFSLTV